MFLIIQFLAAAAIAVVFLRRGAIGQAFGKDAGAEGDEMVKGTIKVAAALFIGAEGIGAPMQQVTIVASLLRGFIALFNAAIAQIPGGVI